MLVVDDIHTYYGDSHILQGVSFEVGHRELVTLLGRNGMGKTTTLRSIMGLASVRSGIIQCNGENIKGKRPWQIFRKGIGYVPQGRQIFSTLTLRENLELAALRIGQWTFDRILETFPLLKERLHHKGNELSGGEQQILAIARSLMGNPDLLLLDEPSEGLAPLLVEMIAETINRLKNEGVSLLLVEQNVEMALNLGDRHYILEEGRMVFHAYSKELSENEEIRDTYLAI